MDWVSTITGEGPGGAPGVIRRKARGRSITATVSTFGGSTNSPSAILKVPLTDTACAERQYEAAVMTRLAREASRAGARVSTACRVEMEGGASMFRLAPLAGVPAASLLAGDARRLPEVLIEIVEWLARWNVATRQDAVADAVRLEREVLRPASLLSPLLDGGRRYLAWLKRRCDALQGASLPFVSTHQDLTMVNILVDSREPFGVLDWESARDDGLPLTDFLYAAADALAATNRYRDRSRWLIESFDPRTAYGAHVEQLTHRLATALGLSGDVVMLMRHACVLQHAGNEWRKGAAPGAFTALAQWLASSTERAEIAS